MRIGRLRRPSFFAFIFTLGLVSAFPALGQSTGASGSPNSGGKQNSVLLNDLSRYLNMAALSNTTEFQPLTQKGRNHDFARDLINPIWYMKASLSAGVNQWLDTPEEWEQGMSGYGKRFADIMGQYAIRNTVMFGFESLLHEDNRYFDSRKKGFWPRTGYALSSGFLARHDNGKRYPSASLLMGFGSGAGLSRLWQPPSKRSAGDAAVSFGISMGWNVGLSVVKEFLPDMLRPLTKGKAKKGTAKP